jgi:protease IV
MRRFLVVSLAVIGALSLLAVAGLVALAMLGAASKPSLPSKLVLELELDEALPEYTPQGSLSLLGEDKQTVRDVVDALERAGEDERVHSLVARVTSTPGSFAATQEVREAILAFRAQGKKAIAYTDSFGEVAGGTGSYYLASAFDEVYVQPSGDVAVTGLATESPFIRGALDKLGARPQFGTRYEYKNAPNTYTEQTFTAPHREAMERLMEGLFSQIVRGIAEGRELDEAAVRAAIDEAPLSGPRALELKLVDGLLYRDEVYAQVKEAAGKGARLLYLHKYLQRAGRPHAEGKDKIALVYGVGGVMRGRSEVNPLSGESSLGAESVAAALRKATEDDDVKAIVFRVDSPGGSYVASDTVRREVQRAREKGKPVVASMGGLAASGGYFVSMEADKIVAQPGTITGSIGVFSGKMVTAAFWERLGVNFETIALGRNAAMYGSDAEFTPEQLAKQDEFLDRVYEDFTQKAAAGRNLPVEKLRELAKGRVWTGEDAKERGLVDELGGLSKALALAKEAAQLPADAKVKVELYPRKRSPAEVLGELLGERSGDNSEDSASTAVRLVEPLTPLLEQAQAIHRAGVRLGLWPAPHPGTLEAQVPEVRW